MEADTDRDGKISFDEFTKMVENTDVSMSMTLGRHLRFAVHALDLFSHLNHFIPGAPNSSIDVVADQF